MAKFLRGEEMQEILISMLQDFIEEGTKEIFERDFPEKITGQDRDHYMRLFCVKFSGYFKMLAREI